VGRLLALTIGVVLLLAALGIALALVANGQLTHNRRLLLEQVGPARRTALVLENALVNEETGVRGLALTGEASFLEPYDSGLRAERRAYRELEGHAPSAGPPVGADVARVRAAAGAWRGGYVAPTLIQPNISKRRSIALDVRGKRLFDVVRRSLTSLVRTLNAKSTRARANLTSAADTLQALLILAGALILGGLLAAGFILRRIVTRPLTRLGGEARRVAAGEFAKPLRAQEGPREIVALGAELEQFAYVASHDLQEPLRKIASFCQALQTRYADQLDERGEQYIEFAVDGAKRMQVLINDLLTFSRVGRGGREHEPVALNDVLASAEQALAEPLERLGGRVIAGPLPSVIGDRPQLVSLLQNLISNALKFHGGQPPVVRLSARRAGAMWEISCTDNGIGVEAEYAERIFLIFQRLHSRDSYEGSGIGLALCRKIVEYHGGAMWLDSEFSGGARFRFTLPVDEGARAERADDRAGAGRGRG